MLAPMRGRWTLGHRPELDGIRGAAILLVLAAHLALPGADGAGAVGVTLFFVLSGFLITALLLGEHDATGRIGLGAFYVRRARRLLPALIASTAMVAAVAPLMDDWWFEWADAPPVLLYVGNWVAAAPREDLGAMGGTWSLAIEEQFYLLWPVLLILAVRVGRRAVLALAVSGAAASVAVRVALIVSGAAEDRVYYGTDTVAFALLLGAALAAWRSGRPSSTPRPVVPVAGWVLLFATSALPQGFAEQVGPIPAAAGAVLVLYGHTGTGRTLMSSRVMRWFGSRSYGLYVWHCPLALLLQVHWGWPWQLLVVTLLPVSLLLAEGSYRWVEAPFRRASRPAIRPAPSRSGTLAPTTATTRQGA